MATTPGATGPTGADGFVQFTTPAGRAGALGFREDAGGRDGSAGREDCAGRPGLLLAHRAFAGEEGGEGRAAAVGQDPADDPGAVVQPRVGRDLVERVA